MCGGRVFSRARVPQHSAARSHSSGCQVLGADVAGGDDVHGEGREALLEKFRNGKTDPLVFGDDDEPEAVVIPFAAFLRLMRRDHADHVRAEDAFQAELSRRVEASDTARSRGEEPGVLLETDEDLFAWAESLGETGKDWADSGVSSSQTRAFGGDSHETTRAPTSCPDSARGGRP